MTMARFEALSVSSRFSVVSLVGIGFCVRIGCGGPAFGFFCVVGLVSFLS